MLALTTGCGQHGGVALVDVGAQDSVANVASLHVTVSNAGQSTFVDVPLKLVAVIPPNQTFTLSFDPSRSGALHIVVDARDASGHVLASGESEGLLEGGRATDLYVTLSGTTPPDFGVADSANEDLFTSPGG